MDNRYYQAVTEMEKLGVEQEYIQGWMCGYLHNPKREEQRLTEAYEAGYEAGLKRTTESCKSWIKGAGQ
jgi:hypothetical protein